MKKQKHMPLFGMGPVYAGVSVLITAAACTLDYFRCVPRVSFKPVTSLLRIASVGCLIAAAILWVNAVLIQKIDSHILKNELVTTGAYAWVRNPIYSAIMLVMWSVLAWSGNLYLLLLCPVYPLLMMILLKNTEEIWLKDRYGQAYLDYCKQVNRCIPWFPKKQK